jgi:hypothetical protein
MLEMQVGDEGNFKARGTYVRGEGIFSEALDVLLSMEDAAALGTDNGIQTKGFLVGHCDNQVTTRLEDAVEFRKGISGNLRVQVLQDLDQEDRPHLTILEGKTLGLPTQAPKKPGCPANRSCTWRMA